MQKIGILVDTTSDLDLNILDNPNIKMIPLQIIFNDSRTFKDKFEISFKEMIESLDEFETKTSLPTALDAMEAIDYFIKQDFTHLFTFTLSSGLSGTHGMIKTLSDEYKGKIIIENIDTLNVTWGTSHVVVQVLDMIDQGKNFEEISEYIHKKIHNRDIFFAVETLKYLVRGGRVSKVSGTVGEALDIKPILTMDNEGKLVAKDKVRGRKKSIAKLTDLVVEAGKGKEIEQIYVLHGDREDDAIQLKERLDKVISAPSTIKHLGTLVCVHAGPGVVGAVVIYK